MLLSVLFWFSVFMIFYVYIGYPVCAYLLSKIYNKQVRVGIFQPKVSILIAAYNEEACIEETIRNKLQLDYPKDHMEIIVISDESNDKTEEIVRQFGQDNVLLLRQEPRAGKTAALNIAVPHAKGEILVFSDANSIYATDALEHLVACFADAQVGYATGKMIYANPDGSIIGDGCSAYMKYENTLREIETKLGSVVGVDGGIDAMRKKLYSHLNPDQLPDFVQPLKVVEQGYRVIYEPKALLKEAALRSASDEYRMRVRVSLRAIWALFDMRQLLFFLHNPLFSWQLWSHKLLRYLCFVFLIGAFVANLSLLGEWQGYLLFFVLQCAAYGIGVIAPQLEMLGFKLSLVTFVRYFSLLNMACAHAFMKFILRRKQVVWSPRKG